MAPARVALSLKVAPTMPEDGFWVVSIEGEAWPIATGSSAQPETASLFDRKSGVEGKRVDVWGGRGIKKKGGSYSPLADTLTGPSLAIRPPSAAEQLLLS